MRLDFNLLKDCQLNENKLLTDYVKSADKPNATNKVAFDVIMDSKQIGYLVTSNDEPVIFVESFESVVDGIA